jgi:hypothetical protein
MGFKLFHFKSTGRALLLSHTLRMHCKFKPLFGAIIAVSGGFENDRNSDVKLRH